MGITLGMNGSLQYNYDGSGLTELGNVTNVEMNLEKAEADVTTRGNSGWRATQGTLKEGSLEFEMVWDDADSGFSDVKDAFLANDPIIFYVRHSTDPLVTTGLYATFVISNLTRTEGLEEAMKANVTAEITTGAVPPVWIP